MSLRADVVAAGREMLRLGLVAGTAGNVSAREGERVHITPSGLAYREMEEDDVVTLSLGGEVLRGFSFVLVAGLIAGTYSTIGIASPIVLWWRSFRDRPVGERKKAKREAGADARV